MGAPGRGREGFLPPQHLHPSASLPPSVMQSNKVKALLGAYSPRSEGSEIFNTYKDYIGFEYRFLDSKTSPFMNGIFVTNFDAARRPEKRVCL